MAIYKGEEYLTLKEVANLAGCKETRVVYKTVKGDLPHIIADRKEVEGVSSLGRTKIRIYKYADALEFAENESGGKILDISELDRSKWIPIDEAARRSGFSKKFFYSGKIGRFAMTENGVRKMISVEGLDRYLKKSKPKRGNGKKLHCSFSVEVEEKTWVGRLANAIITEAAKDLASAYRRDDPAAISECESFFNSGWFVELSPGINGDVMISSLKKWVGLEV